MSAPATPPRQAEARDVSVWGDMTGMRDAILTNVRLTYSARVRAQKAQQGQQGPTNPLIASRYSLVTRLFPAASLETTALPTATTGLPSNPRSGKSRAVEMAERAGYPSAAAQKSSASAGRMAQDLRHQKSAGALASAQAVAAAAAGIGGGGGSPFVSGNAAEFQCRVLYGLRTLMVGPRSYSLKHAMERLLHQTCREVNAVYYSHMLLEPDEEADYDDEDQFLGMAVT